ncbi:putative efflux pump [Clavispora lusitaniae]|nr:putative efflux pump [Clavispora lusitaniae]
MESASHSEPEKTLPKALWSISSPMSHIKKIFYTCQETNKVAAPDNSNKSRPPVFRRRTSKRFPGILHEDGSRELREKDCYDKLGFCFPAYKKWMICRSFFAVQVSMNFNTSIYPNAIPLIAEKWNIEVQKVRVSQMMSLFVTLRV